MFFFFPYRNTFERRDDGRREQWRISISVHQFSSLFDLAQLKRAMRHQEREREEKNILCICVNGKQAEQKPKGDTQHVGRRTMSSSSGTSICYIVSLSLVDSSSKMYSVWYANTNIYKTRETTPSPVSKESERMIGDRSRRLFSNFDHEWEYIVYVYLLCIACIYPVYIMLETRCARRRFT